MPSLCHPRNAYEKLTDSEDVDSAASTAGLDLKCKVRDAVKSAVARSKATARRVCRAIPRFQKKEPAIHPQSASPLFSKLPLDVRQKIWKYTLARDWSEPAPHFHIEDQVLHSCTDVALISCEKSAGRRPTGTGLLLTCRAAYMEAVQFLYEQRHFTLVVVSSHSGPGYKPCRTPLGTLDRWERLLSHMRYVTLIIQPGGRPRRQEFIGRIEKLLDAANYFWRARELCVHFNLHRGFMRDRGGAQRFQEIAQALCPLAIKTGPICVRACGGHADMDQDTLRVMKAFRKRLFDTRVVCSSHADCCGGLGQCLRRGREDWSAYRPAVRSTSHSADSELTFAGGAAAFVFGF